MIALPTLEEREESELETSSESSAAQEHDHPSYPLDLLETSWGSYLYSLPPTRAEDRGDRREGELSEAAKASIRPAPPFSPSSQQATRTAPNEPHPLLQHLEGLMVALSRSKQELTQCGIDTTPLTPLCHASITSHKDLKELVKVLQNSSDNCKEALLSSDVLHNLLEFLREVLQGLVAQGRKLRVQTAHLQQMAKQLKRSRKESLKEQKETQEVINFTRTQLEAEKVGAVFVHLFFTWHIICCPNTLAG